jgi:hypothetical protein
LLRFLISEITYARDALHVPPLKAILSAGASGSDFASFSREILGIPHHRLLTDENIPGPFHPAGAEARLTVLSATVLGRGIDDAMLSVDSA